MIAPQPRVSVLMAVYNEPPARLRQAFESLTAQTYQDWRCELIDDGTVSRETISVIEQAVALEPRVRWHREPHRGLTGSLNRGLELCSSEFVARHDTDDWSEPDRFERQVAFLDSDPVGVVGSSIWLHREDGTPLWVQQHPADVVPAFPKMNPFCHGATMFRHAAAQAVGGYREEVRSAEDYDFFWRMCERFGGANLPEPLYHFRFTRGSISSRLSGEQALHRAAVRRSATLRAEGRDDYSEALRLAQSDLGPDPELEAALTRADRWLLAGHSGAALREFAVWALRRPTRARAWQKLARALLVAAQPANAQRWYRFGQ